MPAHDEEDPLLYDTLHTVNSNPCVPPSADYGSTTSSQLILHISDDDDSDPPSSESSQPISPGDTTVSYKLRQPPKEFAPHDIPSTSHILYCAQQRFHQQRNSLLKLRTTQPRERRRDWSFGPLTGHRIVSLLCVIFLLMDDYWLQDLLWPEQSVNSGFRKIFAKGAILWLTCLLPCVCGLFGILLYRHNDNLDDVPSMSNFVVWRIVSRGNNPDALAATVDRIQHEMTKTPLFPYVIETVTDIHPRLHPSDDLLCLTVPTPYHTPNYSKFKARALHYALEYSPVPDNAWLVHLDEETQPTASGIKGVACMIQEEESSQKLRIGQGAILYHRSWEQYPLLTLADTMRTGDDIARFYLQHVFGVTVFGLHGSYIVCRNDVEKRVGFDFGPVGSITEDAFWALRCMELGSRSRWVDGYMEEQSTQSVMDFMKQRRRWYHGLILVSLYAPVSFWYRLGLLVNTVLWSFAPFGIIYTLLNLFLGCSTNAVVRALANFSLAFYVTLYVLGVEINLKERGQATLVKRIKWYTLVVVLLPWFSLIESGAILYAIIKPETGFHVVQK